MGLHSQEGHVGLRRQGSKGTYATPRSGNGKFMRTRSGALGGDRELLIPDPEIGGNRDLTDAYLGPVAFKGTYEYYPRMESLDGLLVAALGSLDTDWDGNVGVHTITPIDSGSLPWLSIEEQIGDVFEVFEYTDAKCGSVHLEAEATGYLMGSSQFVALTQEAVGSASATTPDFDVTPMTVGSNIFLTWDTGEEDGDALILPAKSFSFDLNNNLEDDDFRLGSLTLGDAVEKRREFSWGVTIRPDDAVLWRTAMYGGPNLTQAGGTVVKRGLQLVCSTYEEIPGGGGTLYAVQFDVPKAVIAPFEVNPSGEDVLQHDLTIRGIRPNPATPICTATVTNGQQFPF